MKIEESIIKALKSVGMPTNIITILSDRNGVEPASPYLIIQVISTDTVSLPFKSIVHREGNVVETVCQTKEFNYALTFHAKTSDGTHDWVEYFNDGLETDMLDWAFVQQGLGIVRSGGIMYQPQPVQGTNYRRAILNITFRAEVTNEYLVNAMSGVEVVGDMIDPTAGKFDEVVVDINFNKQG